MAITKLVSDSLGAGAGGKVLQVLQSVKTDTFTTTSTSFVDVANLSQSITPSSASNKILIIVNVHAITTSLAYGNIVRDSTNIGIGETSGSRISCTLGNFSEGNTNRSHEFSMTFLDSPSTTSATTYKLQVRHENGASTLFINRTDADNNTAAGFRPISTITLMEIAG